MLGTGHVMLGTGHAGQEKHVGGCWGHMSGTGHVGTHVGDRPCGVSC